MSTIRFNRGIPTNVDVDRLVERFAVPKQGDAISHKEIEETINQKYGTHRYTTVVYAWRAKLEREHNVLLGAVPGKGFIVLTASGRVGAASRKYKTSLRTAARAGSIAEKTNRSELSPEERRACDHVQQVATAIRMHAAKEAQKIDWKGEKD